MNTHANLYVAMLFSFLKFTAEDSFPQLYSTTSSSDKPLKTIRRMLSQSRKQTRLSIKINNVVKYSLSHL